MNTQLATPTSGASSRNSKVIIAIVVVILLAAGLYLLYFLTYLRQPKPQKCGTGICPKDYPICRVISTPQWKHGICTDGRGGINPDQQGDIMQVNGCLKDGGSELAVQQARGQDVYCAGEVYNPATHYCENPCNSAKLPSYLN